MYSKIKIIFLSSLFLTLTSSAQESQFVTQELKSFYTQAEYTKLCSVEKKSTNIICKGLKSNIYSHNITHQFSGKYSESYKALPSYEIAKDFKLHL